MNLDRLGLAVCNVAGVHFGSYVKLAVSLGLPLAVVTDWDPLDGKKPPLGKARALDIVDARRNATGAAPLTAKQRERWRDVGFPEFSKRLATVGVFLNEHTFETSVANEPSLRGPLLDVLAGQTFGSVRTSRIKAWRNGASIDGAQLLAMVADIGKGRLAAKLAKNGLSGLAPPGYIEAAIRFVAGHA